METPPRPRQAARLLGGVGAGGDASRSGDGQPEDGGDARAAAPAGRSGPAGRVSTAGVARRRRCSSSPGPRDGGRAAPRRGRCRVGPGLRADDRRRGRHRRRPEDGARRLEDARPGRADRPPCCSRSPRRPRAPRWCSPGARGPAPAPRRDQLPRWPPRTTGRPPRRSPGRRTRRSRSIPPGGRADRPAVHAGHRREPQPHRARGRPPAGTPGPAAGRSGGERILHAAAGRADRAGCSGEERWGDGPLERAIYFFELVGRDHLGRDARILVELLSVVLGVVPSRPPVLEQGPPPAPTAAEDVSWVFHACQDPEIQRFTHVPVPYRPDRRGGVGRTTAHALRGRCRPTSSCPTETASFSGRPASYRGRRRLGELGYWVERDVAARAWPRRWSRRWNARARQLGSGRRLRHRRDNVASRDWPSPSATSRPVWTRSSGKGLETDVVREVAGQL